MPFFSCTPAYDASSRTSFFNQYQSTWHLCFFLFSSFALCLHHPNYWFMFLREGFITLKRWFSIFNFQMRSQYITLPRQKPRKPASVTKIDDAEVLLFAFWYERTGNITHFVGRTTHPSRFWQLKISFNADLYQSSLDILIKPFQWNCHANPQALLAVLTCRKKASQHFPHSNSCLCTCILWECCVLLFFFQCV